MNLFGKILTVIILVLSIVFSVFAVLAGLGVQDWKTQTATLKTELQTQSQLFENLNAKKLGLEREIARERLARARAIAELQSRKHRLEQQIAAKESDLKLEKEKATLALTQLKQASDRTTELDTEVKSITETNNEYVAKIASAAQKLSTVENQLIQMQTDIETKQERLNQLIAQLTQYKSVLLTYNLDVDSKHSHIEPKISARVTGVLKDLVVFTAGKDDGIREGHEFEIYHGNKFVGVLVVIDLHGGNQATARVLSGKQVQIGDSIVTARNTSKTTASRG